MTLDTNIRLLSDLPIFSDLEPEALKLVAFAAERRVLRAGDVLFRQGDWSDGGYVVITGAVALDTSRSSGVAGKIVGAGALLGELALLVATKHPTTAIARQNSTVLKISRALFLRALEESPASAERLKRALSRNLSLLWGELDKARQAFLD
jgi:CRP-like cAMP-binding protein